MGSTYTDAAPAASEGRLCNVTSASDKELTDFKPVYTIISCLIYIRGPSDAVRGFNHQYCVKLSINTCIHRSIWMNPNKLVAQVWCVLVYMTPIDTNYNIYAAIQDCLTIEVSNNVIDTHLTVGNIPIIGNVSPMSLSRRGDRGQI